MATITEEKEKSDAAKVRETDAKAAKFILSLVGIGSAFGSLFALVAGPHFTGAGLFAIAAALSWGILFRTLERR